MRGVASLVSELVNQLGLEDVTLIGNDTGGAIVQFAVANPNLRIGRIVLVSCDAFDNFPTGLAGKTLYLTGKLPRLLFAMFMQQLRVRPIRRLPIAFGWLTKRGDPTTKKWLKQLLGHRRIQSDAIRFLRASKNEKAALAAASAGLASFTGPALVVWAANDRVMPFEHGRRLAELLPDSYLVEITDSYTLVSLDQPNELATAIRTFIAPLPNTTT